MFTPTREGTAKFVCLYNGYRGGGANKFTFPVILSVSNYGPLIKFILFTQVWLDF